MAQRELWRDMAEAYVQAVGQHGLMMVMMITIDRPFNTDVECYGRTLQQYRKC